MNFKTTYVLFALLAVMLVTLGVVIFYNDGGAGPGSEKYVFPSFHSKDRPLAADDVAKVTVERLKPDGTTMVFEKDGKSWKMTSPRAMPADDGRVEELVRALAEARIDEESKAPSAKESGVDEPSRRVTLATKDRELKLTVGHATMAGELGVAYVRSSDRGGSVLVVRRTELGPALEGLNYFRAKDLLGPEGPDLRSVALSRGNRRVVLKKERDRWRMTEPPYGEANISDLLGGLGRLSVHHGGDKDTDFVKDAVTDLKPYELDKQPLRIEVTRGDGKDARTQALLVSDKKDGDKHFATLASGPKGPYDVVKVPAGAVEPFAKVLNDPESLRSKALVDLAGAQQIDAIDVEESGSKLELRKDGLDWKLYRGATATKADEAEVRKLIDELTKRDAIAAFVDKDVKSPRDFLGVDRPDAVTVRVYADSLGAGDEKKGDKKKEAKKAGRPAPRADRLAATLKFGLKREAGVGVERVWGKDSTLAYVPESLAGLVRRGAVAYLEKDVEPFNPAGDASANVTRIEVTHGRTKSVLTREKDGAPWTFTEPKELKSKKASDSAVRALLGTLNRPRVVSVEREKATESELRGFGLADPEVRVAVTLTKDKKPATHTYDLGKQTDKGVYLKLGGKDPVYLADKLLVTDAKQDLRDPTIFSFDADKAATLKVTRWSEDEGAAVTWTFEKKGGQWARSGVANWPVNQENVKGVITELATLRADKFVPAAKGMAVNATDRAIKLEVTTSDKKTYEVTVGAEEGASYHATSPQHPGAAFLLPQAPFRPLKKSFAYLRK